MTKLQKSSPESLRNYLKYRKTHPIQGNPLRDSILKDLLEQFNNGKTEE